jgi:acyl-CoA synthetase (AMP-forming)/AMP-acid ligase II
MNISDMLLRNAHMYPDETALIETAPAIGKRKEITWKQFDDTVNQIANTLQSRGVKKGDKVMQLMKNSLNWLLVYFGVVRTGAWVVPLNFRFTSEDVKYCADISEAKTFIVDIEFVERVNAAKDKMTSIKDFFVIDSSDYSGWENLEEEVSKFPPDKVPLHVNEDEPCGLYFTSGTTGQPKPILLTYKNMEWAAITEQAHHFQTRSDNFILLPPLYHTGAKMHWFGSLLVGGKGTILTEIKPKSIFEVVHKERGTIVWLLVPWAHDILAALDNGELKLEGYDLSCWRLVHMGAQPVPSSLVLRWREYFPEMQYDNNYGLSESTGPGCIHLGLENKFKVDSIGKPGFNWEARVLDDRGNDVPDGEVGELAVKGNGVMKEYYKNPEKTAQTLPNGWLITGDMVRKDSEGFYYIVDRKKDIIICGGENIFPVEIEEILHNNPKIHDVAVIGLHDERLGEVVCAIVQPKQGADLTQEELALYCEQQFPRYKRPRVIIIDNVMRNPTGKLDKVSMRKKYSS